MNNGGLMIDPYIALAAIVLVAALVSRRPVTINNSNMPQAQAEAHGGTATSHTVTPAPASKNTGTPLIGLMGLLAVGLIGLVVVGVISAQGAALAQQTTALQPSIMQAQQLGAAHVPAPLGLGDVQGVLLVGLLLLIVIGFGRRVGRRQSDVRAAPPSVPLLPAADRGEVIEGEWRNLAEPLGRRVRPVGKKHDA